MLLRSARTTICLLFALFLPSRALAQGYRTWYLAEGATGFFEEDILIGNPNATAANIRITYLKPDHTTVVQTFTMPATSRRSVRVNAVPGLENTSISAVIDCTNDLDIVVERTMYFPNATKAAGHNANGVTSTNTRWLFAEGATGFFDEFILVANPTLTIAAVRFTFLKEDGTTIVQNVEVDPESRHTLWVNQSVPDLSNAAFSAVVETTNGVGIMAERAMYFRNFGAGHDSVGVNAPALSWRFAEGFTGVGFDNTLAFETYLLLGNPGHTAADVRVTYFKEAGTPVIRTYTLEPTSRLNIFTNGVPGLANSAFSALVESTNGTPIVAERSVYFGGATGWLETHNTPGITADAQKWAFAEGIEDGALNPGTPNVFVDSFFLVSNANPSALELRATFMRKDGTGLVRNFTVAPESRFTLNTAAFPELSNQEFATFLESTNGVGFTAERTMYWSSANGAAWYAGHGSAGTPWTGAIAAPPPPAAPTLTGVAPPTGAAMGGTELTLTGTNFGATTSVLVAGVPATNVRAINATTILAITPPRATPGPVPIVVTTNGTVLTLASAFAYLEAPVNTPPIIDAIELSSPRAEAGAPLPITATVRDAEIGVDQLQYLWAASPVNGVFTGSGRTVSWVPPSAQVTPAVYTITLTVVDPGVPGAAQQITTSSVTVRYNDSIKENADLALLFLADFSNYNVSPEQCVRNFSDACAGKQEELADIRNNRLNYRILSGTFRVSQVNLLNARTRSNIVAPCTFRSTVNATGQLEVATGTCYMTGVYENFRWRLCESYFTGTVSDPPAGAVPGRVLPRSTAPFGRED